jgi:hypothetical protein
MIVVLKYLLSVFRMWRRPPVLRVINPLDDGPVGFPVEFARLRRIDNDIQDS